MRSSWIRIKPSPRQAPAVQGAGPRFREDGPNADEFGRKEGYPSCKGIAYIDNTRCRVGALSRYDTLFPARTIPAPKQPVQLARAASEPVIRYGFAGLDLTLDDYLNRHPVTGLLIAKDNSILVERYQYGRTDTDRLTSFSMAKSVVALLIGIALKEGAIRSVDDLAETYVTGLKDTEYGRTPIKALLLMASGVAFSEDYANRSSDINTLARLTIGQDPVGSLAAVKQFNTRRAAPGARFSYSSAEIAGPRSRARGRHQANSVRLCRRKALAAAGCGGRCDVDHRCDRAGSHFRLCQCGAPRLGASRSDAGQSRQLAGQDGRSRGLAHGIGRRMRFRRNQPLAKYGYQIWYSADTRRFSLRGLRGQYVLVDPDLKLVLVQTALSGGQPEFAEVFALWNALRAQFQ